MACLITSNKDLLEVEESEERLVAKKLAVDILRENKLNEKQILQLIRQLALNLDNQANATKINCLIKEIIDHNTIKLA